MTSFLHGLTDNIEVRCKLREDNYEANELATVDEKPEVSYA